MPFHAPSSLGEVIPRNKTRRCQHQLAAELGARCTWSLGRAGHVRLPAKPRQHLSLQGRWTAALQPHHGAATGTRRDPGGKGGSSPVSPQASANTLLREPAPGRWRSLPVRGWEVHRDSFSLAATRVDRSPSHSVCWVPSVQGERLGASAPPVLGRQAGGGQRQTTRDQCRQITANG